MATIIAMKRIATMIFLIAMVLLAKLAMLALENVLDMFFPKSDATFLKGSSFDPILGAAFGAALGALTLIPFLDILFFREDSNFIY
jgi:hypothetical protein